MFSQFCSWLFVRPQLAAAAAAELRLSSTGLKPSPLVGDCLLFIGLAVLVGDRIDWPPPFNIVGFRSACAAFTGVPGWFAFGLPFAFRLKLKFGMLGAC